MNANMEKVIKGANLDQVLSIGSYIGKNLSGGEIIELSSDLGGGKTTLVKAIASGAGSKDQVSSPSFTICNQYKAPGFTIYHFDFYRLNDPGIIEQQLIEAINDPGIVVIIEWPEIIEDVLPDDKLSINLIAVSDDLRDITFTEPQSYLVSKL